MAGIAIVLGSVGAAFTGSPGLLTVCRLVTGVGVGAASAVVPSYVSEIAPTSIRGRLGTFWQFAIVIGQLLGLLSGYALARWAGSESAPLWWGGAAWRWMFVVVAVLASGYVVITHLLPRSPADLLRRGRESQAGALVVKVGGRGQGVRDHLAAMKESLAGTSKVPSLKVLRGSRFGLKPIVWVGLLLAAFQQLVGINIVKSYSNTLWQVVGFSTGASFGISIFTVCVSIASTVVAILVMDRVGRRTLLVAGAAVMVPALGTLTVCFASATPTGAGGGLAIGQGAGIAALIAINVFAVGFGVTWGPVMWLMLAELFDSGTRTIAVALCTAVNWLTNWAVTFTFPVLAGVGLSFAYGIYTAFAVLALIFALRVLPETKVKVLD